MLACIHTCTHPHTNYPQKKKKDKKKKKKNEQVGESEKKKADKEGTLGKGEAEEPEAKKALGGKEGQRTACVGERAGVLFCFCPVCIVPMSGEMDDCVDNTWYTSVCLPFSLSAHSATHNHKHGHKYITQTLGHTLAHPHTHCPFTSALYATIHCAFMDAYMHAGLNVSDMAGVQALMDGIRDRENVGSSADAAFFASMYSRQTVSRR